MHINNEAYSCCGVAWRCSEVQHCLLQGRFWRRTAMHVQATVAERIDTSASPYTHEPGKGLGFYTGTDGYLYVDSLRIDDIRTQVMACM